LKDHDVLPNFSDIPSILTTMRHPRRRAISVGPQSEADAYETLAYRQKRRRESASSDRRPSPAADGDRKPNGVAVASSKQSKLDEYEHMMGTGSPHSTAVDVDTYLRVSPLPSPQCDENFDEKEVFSQIKKPRVRYDVEVVTKLIVYTGKQPIQAPIFWSNAATHYLYFLQGLPTWWSMSFPSYLSEWDSALTRWMMTHG
jgi:hypothetical protein